MMHNSMIEVGRSSLWSTVEEVRSTYEVQHPSTGGSTNSNIGFGKCLSGSRYEIVNDISDTYTIRLYT